jgi:hypothetical protein
MAMALQVLGKPLQVKIDKSAASDPRTPAAQAALQALCDRVNAGQGWTAPQRAGFTALDAVVLFNTVNWGGRQMSRPFTDQKKRTFYWQLDELLSPGVHGTAGERRPTFFFHDGWHVTQYVKQKGPSADLDEEVVREIDATDRQIEVANLLGCDSGFVAYLTAYRNDPKAIRDRILQGIGPGRSVSRLTRRMCCSRHDEVAGI